jgi:hypothetical protein
VDAVDDEPRFVEDGRRDLGISALVDFDDRRMVERESGGWWDGESSSPIRSTLEDTFWILEFFFLPAFFVEFVDVF